MRNLVIFSAAWLCAISLAQADEVYPAYQTKPYHMADADTGKYLSLFQSTGNFIKAASGKSAFIVEAYILQNADDSEYTVCGSALLGSERSPTLYAISHTKAYIDVNKDGWEKLGCSTAGGTRLKWVPRKGGGNDIKAFYADGVTPRSAKPKGPPPAVPPNGPLPFGARQQIAAEFEDSLSQVIGAQVVLLSSHVYKEQDGSSTSCDVGITGGRRFRIASPGGADPMVNPTQAQWVAAGCTRPGYQLIR